MLYEILKSAKLGTVAAPDMLTGLLAQKMPFAKGSGEIAELSGVPPLSFRANGEPLLEWRITGNTVEANGVGVRTGNLFDGTLVQGAVTDTGLLIHSSMRVRGEYIPVQPNTQYTLSTDQSIKCIYAYNNQECVDLIFSTGSTGRHALTFTTPDNCNSVCIAIMSNEGASEDTTPQDVEFVMLNTGSTAKPYEPYGYKIPVTCGGSTTNIYIGDSPLYDGDTISMSDTGIVIPTVRGNNVLTVDTTVQPSVYIKYKK